MSNYGTKMSGVLVSLGLLFNPEISLAKETETVQAKVAAQISCIEDVLFKQLE